MIDFNKVKAESRDILKAQPKKLGRKPKAEADKKTERICIYVTKAQKEAIESAARQEFIAIGDYLLKKALQ